MVCLIKTIFHLNQLFPGKFHLLFIFSILLSWAQALVPLHRPPMPSLPNFRVTDRQ